MTLSVGSVVDSAAEGRTLGAGSWPYGRRRIRPHRHDGGKDWLRDVILGGQDGLVNILGIILGVIAGGGSETVLVSAGFAAAMTESLSMGAVGYSSTVADRDYYQAQRALEQSSIRDAPEMEEYELRELYRQKGFSGPLLDDVVATITADRERWLSTILGEERQLSPVSNGEVLRVSVVITLATLVGHLIPLAPFLFLGRPAALVTAVVLSALVLFGVGVYSAVTRVGSWWRNGVKMVAIGLGAAAVGFAIGHLFSSAGSS
jgi:VIT1/CCC1 family predicted Fe2+/Mn2+ transporter